MKFVFKEVSQNNEKYVAEFVSTDQTGRLSDATGFSINKLFIAGNNASDFSQFKVGQSYTLTET